MARRKTGYKTNSRRKYRFFIPYPAIMFVMLCVGVLLALWTFGAGADNVQVSAKVQAASASGPAIITSPADGSHFTAIPITVAGDCPSDGSGGYVKVYHNNIFSGAALCDASNRFSLSSDLFPGANTLKAQIYNVTDDPGPAGPTIAVYYDQPQPTPPAANPSTPTNPGAPGNNIPRLVINTDFRYVGYYINQTTKWELEIIGGTPPYAVSVNWGDGHSGLISRADAGKFTINHKYAKPGTGPKDSFVITINGTDSAGNQAQTQLFVMIKDKSLGPIAATTGSGPGISWLDRYKSTVLKFLWPAYFVVLLMFVSYWLGEREELLILTKKGRLKRRRV